jgi:hypothetical protein
MRAAGFREPQRLALAFDFQAETLPEALDGEFANL